MAYIPRQDGLNDVLLPDGTQVPSGLSAQQLEAMGHAPIPMPQSNPLTGLPPGAVAGPGGGDESAIANALANPQAPAPAGAPLSPFQNGQLNIPPGTQLIAPPSASGAPLPDLAAGVQKLQAEAPQVDATLPAPKARKLVPLGAGDQQQSYTYAPPRTSVTKVKGGDVRASFIRSPGEEVPDDVKSDLVNTSPEQLDVMTVDNAETREKNRLDVDQQLQNQQRQVDDAEVKRAKTNGMLQQKQQLIDQRDRETEKLTPQTAREVWDDKPGLARIFAGLSIAMGGYAQGLRGGSNPGLDIINESIRDEIAGQRARYEDSQKKGQTDRSDYAKAIELYGTPEAAALDLEMRRNAIAAKIIQNHAESITDKEKQQAAFQVADQMRQQRGEVKLKLNELEKGKVLQENWVNVPDRYVSSGGVAKLPPEARKRLVRMPGGQYGFVRAEDARDKVQGRITVGTDILTGLHKLQHLAATANLKTDLKARTQFEAISADTLPLVNVAAGQGAVSEGDRANVEKLLGSPNAIITDNGAALEQAIRAQQSRLNSTIRDNVHRDPDALYPYAAGRPDAESDE